MSASKKLLRIILIMSRSPLNSSAKSTPANWFSMKESTPRRKVVSVCSMVLAVLLALILMQASGFVAGEQEQFSEVANSRMELPTGDADKWAWLKQNRKKLQWTRRNGPIGNLLEHSSFNANNGQSRWAFLIVEPLYSGERARRSALAGFQQHQQPQASVFVPPGGFQFDLDSFLAEESGSDAGRLNRAYKPKIMSTARGFGKWCKQTTFTRC